MIATNFPTLTKLDDKAKQWENKYNEEKKEKEQPKKIVKRPLRSVQRPPTLARPLMTDSS